GLASWLAHGRIILLPTLFGAVLLALFAIDLGITISGASSPAGTLDLGTMWASAKALHVAVDLAGLAIGGGLYIVPTFTAVQVWAGVDRRARVIAAVNVLNAAFIVIGQLVFAALQSFGVPMPMLFLLIGVANFAVAVAIGRTMPASGLGDFLSI